MPLRPQTGSPRVLLPALALLLLVSACAPRLRTSAWVVRFDLDSPSKVASICKEAKQAGFDELLVQVRGRADALYHSDIAPRAENLATAPADFDPLAQLLTDCAPLPLHAWLNVFYLWGGVSPPENPTHPGHPDQPWILSDNNGQPVSGYSERERRLGWIEGNYADPSSAEYRDLFVQVVQELLDRYPVAGIHLDFIRYPGPGYGKSDVLAEKFEQLWGIDPRFLPEQLSSETVSAWLEGKQSPADRILTTAALFWNDFRAGQVSQLVREVRQAMNHRSTPRPTLSAAVFPEPSAAYLENGQEWQAWAAEGLVDALYPMAYFGDTDRVGAQLRQIAHNTSRTHTVVLWAGLGAADKYPEQLGKEARIAGENNYAGVAFFSLGHLLKKAEPPPYVEAVRVPRRSFNTRAEPLQVDDITAASPALLPPNLHTLKNIVRKALNGTSLKNNLEARLTERLREFDHARQQAIPQTFKELKNTPAMLPERVELSGIFRYINPMDSPTRLQEQETLCEKARQRLLSGEDFATVAKEMSQDSSKTMDGLLASRFLDPLNIQDQELARLAPLEITRVMQTTNGFWCYRVEGKSPGDQTTFAGAPWEARRILFRQTLTRIMKADTDI
ncbi:MAG: family 10 glycosylhydrolase [Proteobacteria bacterium]|nr:family 10 glycosylhydrolase [Pseudomonadota bacterium]